MRAASTLLTVVALVGVVACQRDKASPEGTKSTAAAASAPKTALSATGTGDGSGSSIANARALPRGVPVRFPLGCKSTVFFGPFRFTHDPETVEIATIAKTPTGEQVCVSGDWIGVKGNLVGGASIGCVDGPHVAEGKAAAEYSPGNGGSGENPVYLRVTFSEPKPAGCPSVDLSFTLH